MRSVLFYNFVLILFFRNVIRNIIYYVFAIYSDFPD